MACYIFSNLFTTDIRQTTFLTMWLRPRCTDVSSVIYQPVAEITAFFRWDDLPKFHLYFLRFLDSIYQTDPVTESDAMRIRNNRRFAEHIPHDQVRTLSSDSRKFQQFIKIIRDFSIIFITEHAHTCTDIPRFTLAQSAWSYNFFDLFRCGFCQCIDIRVLLLH